MNDQLQQIEDIFHSALEIDPCERAAFLDRVCGDDQLLRQEVETLLTSKDSPVNILDDPPDEEAIKLLAAVQVESLAGQMIDRFRIIARIGAGGMGEVYLAEDQRLNRKVALKLLPACFTPDQDQVNRLQQEARAASALNHPNIITIHDMGQTDSLCFIAMEFIHGETLRQKMRGARMPVSEAVDIAIQVASALAEAHRAGIIHRDIKPENIMLRDDRLVKVLDFGIAKLKEQPFPAPDAQAKTMPPCDTEPGIAWGTVSYMSPEQARREMLDARTDIFSLGVVLHEMITGRRPFEGESKEEVLHALLNDDAPPLSAFRQNAPPSLEKIVSKALKKNPDERYQSASEMIADLRKLRETEGDAERQKRREAGTPGYRDGAKHSLRRLYSTAVEMVRLFRRNKVMPAAPLSDAAAFRGLLPFQEGDRDRFYGRDADTSALFEMITRDQRRFGVLYGESGSGKTSLVTAGLVPELKEAGYMPIYCRSYKDPLAAIVEQCQERSGIPPDVSEPPIQYLRRVAEKLDTYLVIICDQFEEFFINFKTGREREPFISYVAACYEATDLPVKFLFSIRSDFLYLIGQEFDGRIPEPLMGDKRYQLRAFDEEQAEEIIEKSARRAGLPLDVRLCREVAYDLAVGDTVLPSELQIVGAQLQSKRIFTLEEYRRAGGKEQLVHSFLEDVIQESGDREAAQLILRSLISDEDTRLTLPMDEIVRRTQRSRELVERIIHLFVRSRLIREIQEDEPWRYELMHEYLIEKINRITGRVMDATQRANRMLKQYLSNYLVDKGARIPLGKVWYIRRYSDIERGERERELMRKSLRRGVISASALVLALLVVATAIAAALSIDEVWEGIRLSDGHTRAARQAVFSPDGRLLVSVGEDSKVIVWDFARRERIATLTDHTDWVLSAAFSSDGKWFATAGYDKTVIVWNSTTLEKAAVLGEHQTRVSGIAFSPDGRLAASISQLPDARIIVWDVNRWEKGHEFPGAGADPFALIFSPNSRYLLGAQAEENGEYYWCAWDVVTGQAFAKEILAPTDENRYWYGNVRAISPDAAMLVAVGFGKVYFWDASQYWTRKQRILLSGQPGHQDWARAVAFSPDSRLVATGSEDIILWDAKTQTKLARLEHTTIVWGLAFSPDGRWLVSTHGDGAILVWDVAERKRVANFNEHSEAARSVAFSPDGKQIASASDDGSVIIWDADRSSKQAVLMGHTSRATGVAFSSDGSLLASCAQNGEIILWDLAQRRARWENKSIGEHCVAFSPDSRWLATTRGVIDCSGGHWVVRHQDKDWQLAGEEMYGVAFSTDGRRLVCVSPKLPGIVSLWDTENWQLLDIFEMNGVQLISVSISPDGKHLVTGDDDGAVRLWSVNPLKEIAVIGRHSSRLKSVTFSPDGRQVASAGDDKTIALWDVGSRKLVTRIGTHTSRVMSVAFSPDGRRIVSGEEDKTVNVYTRRRTLWGYQFD